MKDIILLILKELPQCFRNFGRLLMAPKRFLRDRNRYSEARLTQALTFAGVSFALYSIILALSVPVGTDFLTRTASHALLTLTLTLLFGAEVVLAWRIVGGRARFGRHWITYLYQQAGFLLIFVVCLLIFFGLLEFLLPDVSHVARNMIMRGGKDEAGAFRIALQAAITAQQQPQLLAIAAWDVLTVLTPWTWFYLSWGAYREIHGLSRARSFGAGVIYLVFFIVSLPIALLISIGVG